MENLAPYLFPVFGRLTDSILQKMQDGGDVSEGDDVTVVDEGGDAVEPDVKVLPCRYTWCIDAGHGYKTEGKRSPPFPVTIRTPQPRLLEYEFNSDITERIIEGLAARGRSYMRTMPVDGDHGNDLTRRVSNANRHVTDLPKLFVSVHGNAGPTPNLDTYCDKSVTGVETWHFHGSSDGRLLAAVFQRHLIARTGMVSRGLRSKKIGQFYVLRATRMTAVLTENGFFNNRYDLALMASADFRQDIADAHIDAIMEVEENGIK